MLAPMNDGFRIQGAVNFTNVSLLRRAGEQWMREHASVKPFVIDLSEMKDQDAASFALLLSWRRTAYKNKWSFSLVHVPVSMQRMSKLFGLSGFI